MHEHSSHSMSSPALTFVSLFNISPYNGCVMALALLFICIYLISNHAKHLIDLFFICISPLGKCLFKSFAHLFLGCFSY